MWDAPFSVEKKKTIYNYYCNLILSSFEEYNYTLPDLINVNASCGCGYKYHLCLLLNFIENLCLIEISVTLALDLLLLSDRILYQRSNVQLWKPYAREPYHFHCRILQLLICIHRLLKYFLDIPSIIFNNNVIKMIVTKYRYFLNSLSSIPHITNNRHNIDEVIVQTEDLTSDRWGRIIGHIKII